MPHNKHNPVGKGTVEQKIRQALRQVDGLTEENLRVMVMASKKSILDVLKSMPDAYIDRWVANGGEWEAVWCVVEAPKNTPKPKGVPA